LSWCINSTTVLKCSGRTSTIKLLDCDTDALDCDIGALDCDIDGLNYNLKTISFEMKGSYYSNMGTSKVSTKYIDETCLEHEGEPFTNFCSANTCIKPLCPECIENHYSHHKNIRTPP
jgi:hypothetical protein